MEKTPEQIEREEYTKDLYTLAKAQEYVKSLFGEDAALDYMINECKNYAEDGKFSSHCYEYAEKGKPPLTEEEVANSLPKTWDGKPIWSYRDLK